MRRRYCESCWNENLKRERERRGQSGGDPAQAEGGSENTGQEITRR